MLRVKVQQSGRETASLNILSSEAYSQIYCHQQSNWWLWVHSANAEPGCHPIVARPYDVLERSVIVRKLGQDIRNARLRRCIPTELLAQRASISRMTLYKVENGDPTVAMSTYATILFVLGLIERISNLADAGEDTLGRQLDEERLPKRIRLPRKKAAQLENDGAS